MLTDGMGTTLPTAFHSSIHKGSINRPAAASLNKKKTPINPHYFRIIPYGPINLFIPIALAGGGGLLVLHFVAAPPRLRSKREPIMTI